MDDPRKVALRFVEVEHDGDVSEPFELHEGERLVGVVPPPYEGASYVFAVIETPAASGHERLAQVNEALAALADVLGAE